jgi:uncharacterized heparinase superfamily protein
VPRRRIDVSADAQSCAGFERTLRSCASQRMRSRDLADRLRQLRSGRIRLLNQELHAGWPLDWQSDAFECAPRLWRFHLQYHEFLLDFAAELVAGVGASHLGEAWDCVLRWIEAFPDPRDARSDDAWHPYCLSRRIPVWCLLWTASPPATGVAGVVRDSLAWQAEHLRTNLERDLGGNHLLQNARGLIAAGCFFSGPAARRWLRTGTHVLLRELPEQVLAHGEHFERSPMYHREMLDLTTDVRDWTQEREPALADACGDTARRMADFLDAIAHPDGEIPLLGDSCLAEACPASTSIPHGTTPPGDARWSSTTRSAAAAAARRVGDYWTWRHERDYLLFDAGPVGPDHLPAHAHADLLNIEISIDGRRFVVDSGVFDYEDGPMRRYCRSTAAHNALEIDGASQCDMWSRFRMGHRGWPTSLFTGSEGGFDWTSAAHNAYRRLGAPTVGRWIACRPGGPWFIVDWALGGGRHVLSNRLHLHPDVRVELIAPHVARTRHGAATVVIAALGSHPLRLESGWYCPRLGEAQPATVLVCTREAALPAIGGWSLSWGESPVDAALTFDGDQARLDWEQDGRPITVSLTCRPRPSRKHRDLFTRRSEPAG